MRYVVLDGNYRLVGQEAKVLAEFSNLEDALNRVAIERHNGHLAYISEVSEGRGKEGDNGSRN